MQSLNFIPLIPKATRFPSGEVNGCLSLLDQRQTTISFTRCSSGITVVNITDHFPVFLNLPRVSNRNENIK